MRICQARCIYVDCEARGVDQLIAIRDNKAIGLNFTCYICNRLLLATRKVTGKWWNLPARRVPVLNFTAGLARARKAEAIYDILQNSIRGVPYIQIIDKEKLKNHIKEAGFNYGGTQISRMTSKIAPKQWGLK